jgi:hypothetical protein
VNPLRVGLILVLALAAAVAANVVLLGVASRSGDPVGKLSPRAALIRLPAETTPSTTRPTAGRPPTAQHGEGEATGFQQDD